MTKDGPPEDKNGGGKKKKDAVPLTGAAKRANKAEDEIKEQTKRLADMGASRRVHVQAVCAKGSVSVKRVRVCALI
jgi:hypothetical protein